jgi:hypothetical protein
MSTRAEHSITCGSLQAELFVTSRAGTFEHASLDSLRLLVRCNQSGPHVLAHAARELQDRPISDLHPFQLTGTAPHAIRLALEAGHSTRYERGQLVAAAIDRCEQIVATLQQSLTQDLALESASLETSSLSF